MVSDKIIQAINTAEKYPFIIRVGVFGSHARNEETAESDIDILIDYDNSSDDFLDDLGGFMEELEGFIFGKIDYLTIPGLMKSDNATFRNAVLRDVMWVYNVRGNVESFGVDLH